MSMSGMVFLFLGDFGDVVHEVHRFREIVELERALDALLIVLPLGNFSSGRS